MATYKVKGVTKENSILAPNIVIAYKADRGDPGSIGEELGRTTANGSGVWEITYDDWAAEVFVVTLDPTDSIRYQAKITDWRLGTLV